MFNEELLRKSCEQLTSYIKKVYALDLSDDRQISDELGLTDCSNGTLLGYLKYIYDLIEKNGNDGGDITDWQYDLDLLDYRIAYNVVVLKQPLPKEKSDSNNKNFNPFDAVTLTTKLNKDGVEVDHLEIDEKALLENIHWTPTEKPRAKWEPNIIKEYEKVRVLHVDIETTGLDPRTDRIIMIGVISDETNAFDVTTTPKEREQLKKGKIFQVAKPNHNVAEALAIANWLLFTEKIQPEVLDLHNGMDFDTRFIETRIRKLRQSKSVIKARKTKYPKLSILFEKTPFYVANREKQITAASMFGKPIVFTPVYTIPADDAGYHNLNDKDIQIVDTQHLAAQLDKINADMTNYKLKYLAHYVKFRKEKRLELKHTEIFEYWYSQEPDKLQAIRDYLIYDLEDQRAIGNYFIPSVWYQKMFFNMPLQELAVASPARKWNSVLQDYYFNHNKKNKNDWVERPEADDKISYEGASTDCIPGLYQNFFKIDVSSLYPSLIDRYHLIDTKKDPHKVSLVVLDFAKQFRYVFKAAANDPKTVKGLPSFKYLKNVFKNIDLSNVTDSDKKRFKSIDGTQKVVINGFYGFLGVGGYNYNSISSAALTTTYGRLYMNHIMRPECERWCNLINLDTDGLCLQPKLSEEVDWSDIDGYETCPNTGGKIPLVVKGAEGEYVNPKFVWARVQKLLPDKIKIDTEDVCPTGAIYAPKKKNYLYWESPDEPVKRKGVFKKRNRTKIQRDFPERYVWNLAFQDDDCAENYAYGVIQEIRTLDFKTASSEQIKNYTITQNIAVNSRELVYFNVGEPKENVSFVWCSLQEYTPKKKQPKKNKTRLPVTVDISQTGEYRFSPQEFPEHIEDKDIELELNKEFYLEDIEKIKSEIDYIVGIE